ncbi:hypothetical protein PRIPAC_94330 [Pristionchus pacificus]|uniref:SMAP domain-containing protein n=1 Tax=Pristionchus pacificus TaxID=54126 RepID=A0A2A6BA47_PRIPA|nr:hypothetical protein PRIPAC_94330 [Pristionchus pacificus]|eukprot:PDM62762.1 hypothetical protein PRIPAC_49977 [Pristionchus pacificus]
MSSHKRFESDGEEEEVVKKEKKKEKKEENEEEEVVKKEKKDKKKKRDREKETEEDIEDGKKEKKKNKGDSDESEERHKEKKKKDKKRDEEVKEHREEKHHDRPKEERSDRDNWRKNDWNRNDNRNKNDNWNKNDDRGGQWKRDRDARQDRGNRGDWNRNDNRNNFRNNDRKRQDPRDNDPSKPAWATGAVMDRAKELKQRQLLWKKPAEGEEASSSTASQEKPVEKNAGMWSAAFTAAVGGNSAQSSKFMKLMGIKNAPAEADNMDDKKVKEEQAKQKALMAGLERQYEVSREFSHQGRGKGLGFGGY